MNYDIHVYFYIYMNKLIQESMKSTALSAIIR